MLIGAVATLLLAACSQEKFATSGAAGNKSGQNAYGQQYPNNQNNNGQTPDGFGDGIQSGPGNNIKRNDQKYNFNDGGDLAEACSSNPSKTKVVDLYYPARRDCAWNQNGNLGRVDGHLQARFEEKKNVSLPANAVLCELGIRSKTDSFQYDDTFFLTFDKYILISSNSNVMPEFQKEKSLSVWNFDDIKGERHDFNRSGSYCLGEDASTCTVPQHDQRGGLSLTIDTETLSDLALSLQNKTSYDVGAVTTGDNDDGDCEHTDLTLEVTLKYID